jgi:hypothetical protein
MTAPDGTDLENNAREQRGSARHRVLLSGKIVYDAGAITLDCMIRDLSASGAKVRLAGAVALPAELYLIDLKSGVAYEGRVAWRRLPEIGLHFHASHKLSEASDPALAPLKRIWVEHIAR